MKLSALTVLTQDSGTYDVAEESAAIGELRMRNGTFKLTKPDRLLELDKMLAEAIAGKSNSETTILDIGVSTGITTLELLDTLRSEGIKTQITATDLYFDANVTLLPLGIQVLSDSHGWLLEYKFFGMAIRPWISRRDYFTLKFIPKMLIGSVLRRSIKTMIAEGKNKPIKLINSQLRGAAGIRCVENDVLESTADFVAKFDIIRAANILNRSYFDEKCMIRALRNIRSYAKGAGSLFLVVRSEASGRNCGTLFQLNSDGKFSILRKIGTGSEIESLVLGMN